MSQANPDAIARIGTEKGAPFFVAFFDTVKRTFIYQQTTRAQAKQLAARRGISINAYKPTPEIMIQWLNAA